MKQKTIYLSVRIDYSYNENEIDEQSAAYIAENLAIRPNYNSFVDGVLLEDVELCGEIDSIG